MNIREKTSRRSMQEKSVNNEHQGKDEWEEQEKSLNNEHQGKDE